MSRRVAKGLAVALGLALVACKPSLYALSPPPPGRSGWLDSKHLTLTVSLGVAIAFACDHGGPCKDARATSDDPSIASVSPAHLARLEARFDPGWSETTSMVPATSFVVVGRAAGTTAIRVRTADGDRDLRVTVLADPAPAATATR